MTRKITLMFFLVMIGFLNAQAQNIEVSGTIMDEEGMPLLGVNIIQEGTNNGTQTDFDGNYTISVPENASLVFSFIGYLSQTIPVQNRNQINVTLSSDVGVLDEVVIVAYGQQRKEEITGSVTTISEEELGKVQSGNVVQGLSGKVPGVQVINQTGQPGDAPSVRFRGIGSINSSNEPLYVVDGVVYNGNINAINQHDIASMTFLKDASANALYGSRGANGVIIITTKKGKNDTVEITLDTKVGFNTRAVPEYDIFREPGQYYEAWFDRWRIALIDAGVDPTEAAQTAASQIVSGGDYSLGYNNYDVADNNLIDPETGRLNPNANLLYKDNWEDAAFSTGLRTEHYINLKYNNDQISTFFSAGNLEDEGYALNSGFKRNTVRSSSDYTPKEWLKIGGSINYAKTDQDSPLTGKATNTSSNLFNWVRGVAPIYPIYARDASGNIIIDGNSDQIFDFGTGNGGAVGRRPAFLAQLNPIGTGYADIYNFTTDNLSGRLSATIDFLEDFSFSYNYSLDLFNTNITQFTTPIGGDAAVVNGRITSRANRGITNAHQQLLNWNKEIGDHSFSVLLGHESNEYDFQYLAGQKTQAVIDDLPILDNAVNIQFLTGSSLDYNVEGYFSRLTYNFANKYYINASLRRDGSSVFHPDNRWGTFYGFGGAWSVHRENFLSDNELISQLRLKASYGQQGNDALQYDQFRALIGFPDNRNYYAYTDQYDVVNAGNNVPGIVFFQLGNKDLLWETSTNINAGFELGLWENRLYMNAEYFVRKVDDLLFYNPIAVSEGVGSIPENVGDMENKGIEISIAGDLIRSEDLNWSVNIHGTHYANEITSLPDESIDDLLFQLEEGRSRYDYYTREYAGVDPENGDALWYADVLDDNGNPTGERITTEDYASSTEYFVGKSAIPDVYGGFGTQLGYKGFSLNVNFAYQIGGYGFDGVYQDLMANSTLTGNNMHKDVLDSWTPENTDATIPRVDVVEIDQFNNSDYFLVDASYLSLQDVTVSYTFNRELMDIIGLNSATIYATGNNLHLWSNAREGYDPRLSITGNAINEYSIIRSTSLGLTLKF